MEILKNYDLSKLNTFGVQVSTLFFVEIKKENDLQKLFKIKDFKENKRFFLGGGSNTLFVKDFAGLVILNKLQGIEIIEENNEYVLVRSMGGVGWHDLVLFTVDRGYWGIENLSFIPGTVGAAPMQNIGAYGVELKDVLESVEAYSLDTNEKKIFKKSECAFGYRDSVFKNKFKNKYFISAIILKLSKIPIPNVSYKILAEYLKKNKIKIKNSKDVSNAVTAIRQSKLPNPKVIGNAGSFFKNVFVEKDKLEELRARYPEIPYFEEEKPHPNSLLEKGEGETIMKIPAGWLIEYCGWKGKRIGNVGVHEKQALVLVNYGGATGAEIHNLALKIIDSVFLKFGLKLEMEVNLI